MVTINLMMKRENGMECDIENQTQHKSLLQPSADLKNNKRRVS